MNGEQRVFGLSDLCQFLKLGPTTVYQLRRSDPTFPQGRRVGRTMRWLQSDIEAWVRSGSAAQEAEVAK